MKILLADDDAVSRRILQRALEHRGFDVTCVDDGQAAVDALLSADGPRMAILDWVMPVRDGLSVCREVRAAKGHPYVYMILLTAREASKDVVLGLEAGADDYLTKPCNPHELKARMRAGQRVLELQDRLIFEAQHDPLTKLPNRACFVQRLAENVRKTHEQEGFQFTLLFVDIDRFKMVNDSLGHLIGDELMKGIALRLLLAVRTEASAATAQETEHRHRKGVTHDIVARIGGDEFVILLDDFADVDDGVRVAERVQHVLKQPFFIEGHEIFITASIGISTSSGGSTEPEEILSGADSAMYKAKILGKARYEISDMTENAAAAELFRLENDLRRAIEDNQFEIHFQPILNLADGRIVSFEALVRWRHPELGLLQPGAFIPAAEESGLIVPIGDWVLYEACRQMQAWNAACPSNDPITVCVNISPRQFGVQNLVERVRQVLDQTGLDPSCLELEITENLTIRDSKRAVKILSELCQLGISLSLDDFGTGYSSLSYLQRLPIRTLKIDRSFIAGIEKSKDSSGIARAVISLGHNLGMRVIAEGIETKTQKKLLKDFHCDLGQGYLFSRPVPAEHAHAMLQAQRRKESEKPRARSITIDRSGRADAPRKIHAA